MFANNAAVFRTMLFEPRFLDMVQELEGIFRGDPAYSPRKLKQLLFSAARGERVARFDGRYVISSIGPPLPSRAFVRYLTGGVRPDRLFSDLAQARRSVPASAYLGITRRCNYDCEHCGATVVGGDPELTTQQWIKVVRGLQDLGIAYVAFSGGEPLLRDDLETILGSMDDRSTTLLFTNGRGLSLQRAQALKQSGLYYLAVSLDSPEPAEHNRIRGNADAFSHAVAAIRNSVAAGLFTLISSVVYRRDLSAERIMRLVQLAKEHGAHEVRIHQPIPRGRLSETENAAEIFYTVQDLAQLYRIQFAINRMPEDLPRVSSLPYTEGRHKLGCGAGVLHSYITSTGDLWPCDFVPLSFGNVVEEDLKDVYARMISRVGTPKTSCWARRMAAQLRGKSLPLSIEDSVALCLDCQSHAYPRFYRDLQTQPGMACR